MSVNCCGQRSVVYDTRMNGAEILRRRRCEKCSKRWVTFEISYEEYKQLKDAASGLRSSIRVRRRKLNTNPSLRIA